MHVTDADTGIVTHLCQLKDKYILNNISLIKMCWTQEQVAGIYCEKDQVLVGAPIR